MGQPFYPEFYPNGQMGFPEQPMPYQPHAMGAPQPQMKNLFGEESRALLAVKFGAYEFIQCVCEGKQILDPSQAFRCNSCKYCYHYLCLRIEKATK